MHLFFFFFLVFVVLLGGFSIEAFKALSFCKGEMIFSSEAFYTSLVFPRLGVINGFS